MYALKKAVKINFKDGILKNLHKIGMKPKMPSQIRSIRNETSGLVNKINHDILTFVSLIRHFTTRSENF